MTVNDVIEYFGSATKVARALGISPQAVRQWVEKDEIPTTRQYQIQVLSNGCLIAGKSTESAA